MLKPWRLLETRYAHDPFCFAGFTACCNTSKHCHMICAFLDLLVLLSKSLTSVGMKLQHVALCNAVRGCTGLSYHSMCSRFPLDTNNLSFDTVHNLSIAAGVTKVPASSRKMCDMPNLLQIPKQVMHLCCSTSFGYQAVKKHCWPSVTKHIHRLHSTSAAYHALHAKSVLDQS